MADTYTIWYSAFGVFKPYCPEYTNIPKGTGRAALIELRARFPRERLCLMCDQVKVNVAIKRLAQAGTATTDKKGRTTVHIGGAR